MDARSLLSSIGSSNTINNNNNNNNAALSAVIFLVGRDANGSEGLSSLMMMDNNNSMLLAGVQARYLEANEIYYHVTGVESARTVARDARESSMMVGEDNHKVTTTVAEVTMEEFQRKLASMAQSEVEDEEEESSSSPETKISKAQQKRRKAISEADVLVVSVAGGANKSLDSDSIAKLDAAIVAAIDSSAIQNVVLSSIRSTHEVKHARKLAVVERLTKKWSSTTTTSSSSSRRRRRLEDAAAAEDNADNNNQAAADMSGIYYVNMTPNIFAGLLFFLLFVMTAYIGLTCMNMIEGQDVYVKKMPHIGREV